jgi:hypothetical protein
MNRSRRSRIFITSSGMTFLLPRGKGVVVSRYDPRPRQMD